MSFTTGPAPQTRRDDVVETLHGHTIEDPYRWLEDADSPETVDWVDRQRSFTEEALGTLSARESFRARLTELYSLPVDIIAKHCGGRYLMWHDDGHAAQPVVQAAENWRDLFDNPTTLLDPNGWSKDGTTSLQTAAISPDGSTLAWASSAAGSDWTSFTLRDLDSGQERDPGIRTKFSGVIWFPDSVSLLVLDFPDKETGETAVTKAAGDPRLVMVRTDTGEQTEVLPAGPEGTLYWGEVSHDIGEDGERTGDGWIVVSDAIGTSHDNGLTVFRHHLEDGHSVVDEGRRIAEADAAHEIIGIVGSTLFILTDDTTPTYRLVSFDLSAEKPTPTEVIASTEHPLSTAVLAEDVVVAVHMVDVSPRISRWSNSGKFLGDVDVEAGAVLLTAADEHQPDVFIHATGPSSPNIIYHLDATTGRLEKVQSTESGQFCARVERRHATSADGTQVPYWYMRDETNDATGPLPTIVYGYGGFDVTTTNTHSPLWQAWMEAGGAVAIVNARGGGEFGAQWYRGGILDNKQHVFDDHIGVLLALIDAGLATPDTLAITGGSNGGLMAGAVLTQRPDLLAAAVPEVGVLDLLRFHKFSSGAAWMSDYGNPDDAHDFEVELAYSPLHNVVEGRHYPATLVMTGDHDDRVVPAHSHKFTATLQRAQGGDAPILTRIDRSVGHGAGRPRASRVNAAADKLAFIAEFTGLTPQF
ncbi:prolyl oligopeptidase family serine peptidase [Cutibacterium equinum]|uniref:prolyl oligopeptidase n=1 Tax=Cutibacterium equinum TaxID=3016342 RepID=A0ABY7QWR6_9ACTN|nr:prolyl oligopeptidase family serine peptidase [Cutibacterium equinum]WCC79506.1 prolyl oligopeptidase family serine peptidase [Cutibacterium equinum]